MTQPTTKCGIRDLSFLVEGGMRVAAVPCKFEFYHIIICSGNSCSHVLEYNITVDHKEVK